MIPDEQHNDETFRTTAKLLALIFALWLLVMNLDYLFP